MESCRLGMWNHWDVGQAGRLEGAKVFPRLRFPGVCEWPIQTKEGFLEEPLGKLFQEIQKVG